MIFITIHGDVAIIHIHDKKSIECNTGAKKIDKYQMMFDMNNYIQFHARDINLVIQILLQFITQEKGHEYLFLYNYQNLNKKFKPTY